MLGFNADDLQAPGGPPGPRESLKSTWPSRRMPDNGNIES
jgi:hypothetical protein